MRCRLGPYRVLLTTFIADVVLGAGLGSGGYAIISGFIAELYIRDQVKYGIAPYRPALEYYLEGARRGEIYGAIGGAVIGLGLGLIGVTIILITKKRPHRRTWILLNLLPVIGAALVLLMGIAFFEFGFYIG